MNGIVAEDWSSDGDQTKLNEIIDRFDAEWKAGKRPSLADFDVSIGDLKSQLIMELIEHDIMFRRRVGENPTKQEYHGLFRDSHEIVERYFAHQASSESKTSVSADHNLANGVPIDGEARFTVVKKLGEGGMGVVYLAFDTVLDRNVAIKLVRLDRIGSSLYESLKAEAKHCARLKHPGIVQIYDVISDKTVPLAIVMEYVGGTSLDSLIREKLTGKSEWFDVHWVVQTVAKIADALEYLHGPRGRLLHGDLKPGNIVIDEDDNPVIVDFGLALDRESLPFAARDFAGTLDYMALEQLKGLRDLLKPTAEVWSLGVILYQLLSGEMPFKSRTLKARIKEIEESPPSSLRHLSRSQYVSEELEEICCKCLARSPHDRFQTTGQLAKSLRRVIATRNQSLLRRMLHVRSWNFW